MISVKRRPLRRNRRTGAIIVLTALVMSTMFAMVAFAIDCGVIALARNELQNAADAGACAGASALSRGTSTATSHAVNTASANRADGHSLSVLSSDIDIGTWDFYSRSFTPLSPFSDAQPTAVQVTCVLSSSRGTAVRLFFGPLLGVSSVHLSASAVALKIPDRNYDPLYQLYPHDRSRIVD